MIYCISLPHMLYYMCTSTSMSEQLSVMLQCGKDKDDVSDILCGAKSFQHLKGLNTVPTKFPIIIFINVCSHHYLY